MRFARSFALRVAVVAAVLAVVAIGLASWWVRRPWPQVRGDLMVAGLEAEVEVIRDPWGTAHLYADSPADLFFAQGWVHAQDRLWQMEMNRRAGSGTLAAVVGEAGLSLDKAVLTIGLRRAAEREWQRMRGEGRAILEAYTRGVNTYRERFPEKLALEFSLLGVDPLPWTPVDSLTTIKLVYWQLSENATFELARARYLAQADAATVAAILPPYSEGEPVILPDAVAGYAAFKAAARDSLAELAPWLGVPGPGQGSNAWVVAGTKTASGKPMLANDTHLDLFMPSPWYAVGLHGAGFDAVGYGLAGTPLLVSGHNQAIAWAVADLVPDVEDLYLEQLDDRQSPTRYRFKDEWLPLEVHEHQIDVKGAEKVPFRVLGTHHGFLVNGLGGSVAKMEPMALAWPGHHGETLVTAMSALVRARDWAAFRSALADWDGPQLSFLYGDREGNIGYQAAGRIPVRAAGHDGAVPVPGWTGAYDWQGDVPFEELPTAFNPPGGLLVAANQKAVGPDYPYALGYEWADPYRALRITDLLADERHATVESMAKAQGDTFHLPASRLRPWLLDVPPANELERRALEQMRAWDLRLDPEQTGPSIYQVWYRTLVWELLVDELGETLAREYLEYEWVHGPVVVRLMEAGQSPLFDDRRTAKVEGRPEIAERAFRSAVSWLAERYGGDPSDWRWGRLHTVAFAHRPLGLAGIPIVSRLFNGGPFPSPAGDRFTVNAGWLSVSDREVPYGADGGATMRWVIDLADWETTRAVNSTGQSEHLFHPHREDLLELWRTNRNHPLPFARSAVDAAASTRLVLRPASKGPGGSAS